MRESPLCRMLPRISLDHENENIGCVADIPVRNAIFASKSVNPALPAKTEDMVYISHTPALQLPLKNTHPA